MEKFMIVVRQVLKIVGGALVGAALISEQDVASAIASVEGVSGALMVAFGVGMTIWNTIKGNLGK